MKRVAVIIVVIIGFALEGWGQEVQFYDVIQAKMSEDTLQVRGFLKPDSSYGTYYQVMNKGDVYTNKIFKYFPTFSLLTVPFKIRPKTDDVSAMAHSDLKNIVINIDILSKQWDRYFATGKTSTHRISGGIFFSPLVEALTIENTKNHTANNSQLFLSTGVSFNYSYNKLTFTVIPVGFDIATNSAGKEWIHDCNYWLGFGIGVDLKILEGVLK